MEELSANAEPFYPSPVERLANNVRRLVMIKIICDNCSTPGTIAFGPWVYPVSDFMEIQLCKECYDKYYHSITKYWDQVMFCKYAKLDSLIILDSTTGLPYTGSFIVKRSSGNMDPGWIFGANSCIFLRESDGELYVRDMNSSGKYNSVILTRDCKLSDLVESNSDIQFTFNPPSHFPKFGSTVTKEESDEYEVVDDDYDDYDEEYEEYFEQIFTGGW